ncbi:polysulfide reductase, NrfD [Peptococcaceae bacterium CEB3]|nr:polysulfide reductase, NrfD [Peptococcaceae bacterium CEB3]
MVFVDGMAQMTHVMPFGILVVLDFFLVATSAGLVLLSALGIPLGWGRLKPFSQRAAYLALATVIAGPVALLADLGHPLRFLNLFLHFNVRSAMSWGSYILLVYIAVVAVYAWLLRQKSAQARPWAVAVGFLALALITYTGMLLAEAHTRFLWSTALTPALFIVSGVASALGLLAFGLRRTRTQRAAGSEGSQAGQVLRLPLLWVLAAEGVLTVLELLSLMADGARGWGLLKVFFGPLQPTFLWLQLVIGLILPMVVLLKGKGEAAVSLAGAGTIIGVFFLRYNWVIGGQILPQSGNVYNYQEQSAYTWAVFVFALAVAGVLALLIPKLFETVAARVETKERGVSA